MKLKRSCGVEENLWELKGRQREEDVESRSREHFMMQRFKQSGWEFLGVLTAMLLEPREIFQCVQIQRAELSTKGDKGSTGIVK